MHMERNKDGQEQSIEIADNLMLGELNDLLLYNQN